MTINWTKRGPGDYFFTHEGKELARIKDVGKGPLHWNWALLPTKEWGRGDTMAQARVMAEMAIRQYLGV